MKLLWPSSVVKNCAEAKRLPVWAAPLLQQKNKTRYGATSPETTFTFALVYLALTVIPIARRIAVREGMTS